MANKKKLSAKVYIALWMLLLVSLGIYYLFLAPRDSEFSQEENRYLAAFPAVTAENIFSGNFSTEIENYLLDHFPGRSTVISATSRVQNMLSFATHDEYLLIAEVLDDAKDTGVQQSDLDALLADLNKTATEPTQPETVPATTEPAETLTETEPPVTEPVEDPPITPKPEASLEDYPATVGMYMDIGKGERAMQRYMRNNVAAVTAVLNKYAQLLPENGKLMFTLGPHSNMVNQYVNAEERISFYSTWDEVVNGLGDDNVYAFDSTEIFAEQIEAGEYVSFRVDHHWTPRGAYFIYEQMIEQAGKDPCSYYDDFDITIEENFRGTYFRNYPDQYYNVEPDTLELLMPKIGVEYRCFTAPGEYKVKDFLDMNASKSDRYAVYLGGPGGPWRYVECDNEETENCLVLTDSYGLTMIPFLTNNYKQVHYYDPRYYQYSPVGNTVAEMIEEYNIQDVYVIAADFNSFDSDFLIYLANWHLNLD